MYPVHPLVCLTTLSILKCASLSAAQEGSAYAGTHKFTSVRVCSLHFFEETSHPVVLCDHVLWCLQICLSAALTLVALPVMVKGTLGWLLPRQAVQWIARLAPRLACGAIMVLSLSRVAALLLNYGAPLHVYQQLPEASLPDNGFHCYACHSQQLHGCRMQAKCCVRILVGDGSGGQLCWQNTRRLLGPLKCQGPAASGMH